MPFAWFLLTPEDKFILLVPEIVLLLLKDFNRYRLVSQPQQLSYYKFHLSLLNSTKEIRQYKPWTILPYSTVIFRLLNLFKFLSPGVSLDVSISDNRTKVLPPGSRSVLTYITRGLLAGCPRVIAVCPKDSLKVPARILRARNPPW